MTAAWQFVETMLGIDYGWEVRIETDTVVNFI
jgi:hypothetical protein